MQDSHDLAAFFKRDRFAQLVGIELVSAGKGAAVARLEVKPEHLNGVRTVQGGAIFTLADFAFAAACNSHGQVAVAIQAGVTFLKAVSAGTLTAEAVEESVTPKLGTYTVRVRNETGDLVAIFEGLAYRKGQSLEEIMASRP
jgi:acyl-CoA thioesterase